MSIISFDIGKSKDFYKYSFKKNGLKQLGLNSKNYVSILINGMGHAHDVDSESLFVNSY